MSTIIESQVFSGELYIKASDHHRVVAAAVSTEREACAQICEAMRPTEREFDQRFYTACTLNANAIRNRSKGD